jgi:TolA-binding protein
MMGIAYVRTGENAKATAVFTRLIKEYPGSEAAKKASKRLKSLL